jgi:hypothetical protein
MERDDLTFTARNGEGRIENWCPAGDSNNWGERFDIGKERFAEIIQMADSNEYEAWLAIRFALTSPAWCSSFPGRGEEVGFADELARAAMVGLRAIAESWTPYDEKKSEIASLENRVAFLEQQLAANAATH